MQSLLSHGGHNRKRDGIPSNPAGFTSVLVYARRFTHRKYKKKKGEGTQEATWKNVTTPFKLA